MKKNAFIKNAVKQLEWRMTAILKEEFGPCQYDWEKANSPVRVLKGNKGRFYLSENNINWNGTVCILGDGRQKIVLNRETSIGRRLEKLEIQIIA